VNFVESVSNAPLAVRARGRHPLRAAVFAQPRGPFYAAASSIHFSSHVGRVHPRRDERMTPGEITDKTECMWLWLWVVFSGAANYLNMRLILSHSPQAALLTETRPLLHGCVKLLSKLSPASSRVRHQVGPRVIRCNCEHQQSRAEGHRGGARSQKQLAERHLRRGAAAVGVLWFCIFIIM
jgi:hypothetical protein